MADQDAKKASRQEAARQYRKDAYKKMKAQRATDPRYLAMKESVKLRRREMYQQIKAKRKASATGEKSKAEIGKSEARAAVDAELMKMVKLAAKGPYDVN